MRPIIILALIMLVSACSSTATKAPTPPAPGVKIGKPYEINGETYTPKHDPEYDEIGMASWYGPGFHGRYTANGEVFNQDDITAAHTTLPLPSLVRVTNLENGKSAVVRINDRGPFKSKRIIDLSRGSARELGITGLARVRVQFLREETESYWASRQLGTPPPVTTVAARKGQPESVEPYSASTVTSVAQAGPVEETAPIMSVSSTNISPEQMKVRPVPPTFRIVNEAEAAEPAEPAAPEIQPASPQTEVAQETVPMPVQSAPSAQKGWYVQAGSFASVENAQALAHRLGEWGQVQINEISSNGRMWHRVKVGPVGARELAETLKGKMLSLIPDARVIQE